MANLSDNRVDFNEKPQLRDDHRGAEQDVFGSEEHHEIKYRTLSWPVVSLLMITEIVSNGMYTLPSSSVVVGLVPNVIIITFLGLFATYTAKLLVDFKLRHPQVHSMGDAGYIMFGPIGREVLAFGTVAFAIMATGTQLFAGYTALATLSDNKLCLMAYIGIFSAAILVLSVPRTLDQLGWLSYVGFVCIAVSAIVGMIGAGLYPTPGRTLSITQSSSFYEAFLSVTNPVFAYAGHFMFFILISEMRRPQDAMKAAYALQGFATSLYIIFTIVMYYYIGNDVQSIALLSLEPKWAKAALAIGIPNFLIGGALYSHTASKLAFVRIFRESHHLHSHTVLSWSVWLTLIILANGAAFILAVGVPIFSYIVGLTASLFAAWYTYGIAGMFLLHTVYKDDGGVQGWRQKPIQSTFAVLTVLVGALICVAGCYVTIKGIVLAYDSGQVSSPFSC